MPRISGKSGISGLSRISEMSKVSKDVKDAKDAKDTRHRFFYQFIALKIIATFIMTAQFVFVLVSAHHPGRIHHFLLGCPIN